MKNRVALLFWTLLALALLSMLWAQSLGFALDVDHYKFWTKLVTEQGIQAAYSGTFPHTYAIYPPVTLYFYWGIGQVYRAAIDPSFDIDRALASGTLTSMIKVPPLVFHLLTAALIYVWLRGKVGRGRALLAMGAYALQPGIIFDVAVWGQADPVHSFFTLASVLLLIKRRVGWAGAAFALAALAKPQPWVLAPLFLVFAWRSYGLRALGAAGLAGVATAVLVAAPFLWSGTWRQLVRLPLNIASAAHSVSANADNLWWLILGERAFVIRDHEPFLFGVSYEAIGAALAAVSVLFVVSRLNGQSVARGLPALAALQSFAFFMLMTKAHENHAFLVLPLLSLVWVGSPGLRWIYVAASGTFLANIALHDPVVVSALSAGAPALLQRVNAVANMGLLVVWIGVTLLRGGEVGNQA